MVPSTRGGRFRESFSAASHCHRRRAGRRARPRRLRTQGRARPAAGKLVCRAAGCGAARARGDRARRQAAPCAAGAAVVSESELKRARAVGVPPEKIVFSGIGKTERELALAVEEGLLCVNVESEGELELLSSIAAGKNRTASISIRVNPDIDAKT